MSYILDALRKSQRERALGNIPHLDTPAAAPGGRRGVRYATGIAAVAVLIAAGVVTGMYLGRPPAATPQEPAPRAGAPAAAASDVPEGAGGTAVQATAPAGGGAVQAFPPEPAPETTPPPAPAAADGPAPLLSDTPMEFQRSVPAMTLNVVSYSETPQRRFVMIDLVMYREGQTLPNGATVVAIGPDEVTFSFTGRRFRLRP